jgi:hypothetical protein
MEEPRIGRFQDSEGRDLEATIQGDGFDWQLFVDIQTKDAVVRKRFKDNSNRASYRLTIPAKFVDYEHVLQEFVDSKTKK